MALELLAEKTRAGIKSSAGGFVLDAHMDAVLADPRFAMLLVPMPKAVGRDRSRSRRQRGPGRRKDKNTKAEDNGKNKGGKGGKKGQRKGQERRTQEGIVPNAERVSGRWCGGDGRW